MGCLGAKDPPRPIHAPSYAGVEMRELQLAANGLSFHCLADGPEDGPLALLLHGFPESAESWAEVLPALAGAGFLAVAPDLRGYGGTDCPEGGEAYGMAHLVDDVAGLVEATGRQRCHLAGHDWGALVGWAVVERRPERVATWSALSVGHPAAFLGSLRDDPDQQRRSEYVGLFLQPGRAEAVLATVPTSAQRRSVRSRPRSDPSPCRPSSSGATRIRPWALDRRG